MTEYKTNTKALHVGQETVDPVTRSRAVPLYQTASYMFDDTEHAAQLFKLNEKGYIYSRNANPTNAVFEERLAALENGKAAFSVASGQAAILLAILNVAQVGDEIVSTNALYGGTYTLFERTLPRFGITTRFVDGDDFAAIEAAINENTKAVYTETIGNPSLQIAQIDRLAAIAHKHNVPLIVDNTFATPILCRPLELGADIVVHSTTKFIGGHGTSLGGIIVDGGSFDWNSGRFPQFTEENSLLEGRSFVEINPTAPFVGKVRFELGHDLGATLSPFNAWLFIQGLESLPARIRIHRHNALEIAKFLEKHPAVEWVNYPSLETNAQYELAQKYLPKGAGSIFSFGVKGGLEAAKTFINNVELLSHVANVGDSKSLVIHPASTSHSRLTAEQQLASGVTPGLIRLSIGLEDLEDLTADFEQALQKAAAVASVE